MRGVQLTSRKIYTSDEKRENTEHTAVFSRKIKTYSNPSQADREILGTMGESFINNAKIEFERSLCIMGTPGNHI